VSISVGSRSVQGVQGYSVNPIVFCNSVLTYISLPPLQMGSASTTYLFVICVVSGSILVQCTVLYIPLCILFRCMAPECIKLLKDGQAFSRSYDLAPRPPPLLLSQPLEREGEGGGRGVESYDRKKVWSSINHSILSG